MALNLRPALCLCGYEMVYSYPSINLECPQCHRTKRNEIRIKPSLRKGRMSRQGRKFLRKVYSGLLRRISGRDLNQ